MRRENRCSDPVISSLLRQARTRAKQKHLAFSLKPSDILIPAFCPILGIPIYPSTTGQPGPNSPSLDRLDNTLGYTPSNVKVISFKANTLKREMSLDDLYRIIRYIETFSPLRSHLSDPYALQFPACESST